MASYNKVLLMGNLTRNPELRYTPSGKAVCDLTLAVNENFKNKAGETVEQTVFVDVVVWGKQAESSSEYLKKGSGVFIDGRLQLDKWVTQEGEKRSKLRVRAVAVQFTGKPEKRAQAQTSDDSAPKSADVPADFDEYEDDIPF